MFIWKVIAFFVVIKHNNRLESFYIRRIYITAVMLAYFIFIKVMIIIFISSYYCRRVLDGAIVPDNSVLPYNS